MEWFGFWIFLSVCVAVDAWLFAKGYDSFFFEAKTPEEKKLREAAIAQQVAKAGEKD